MTLRQVCGRILYRSYYAPLQKLQEIKRAGGLREWRVTESGRAEMEAAAAGLPRMPAFPGGPIELHLLTGSRFWYQSAYCLYSFGTHANRSIRPHFYDDGSLTESQCAHLTRLFPHAVIVKKEATIAVLDRDLPRSRFPTLRERWDHYPNIRKLIDPHLGKEGFKLVIDSDLLFFRRPELLVRWCDAPTQPLHAVDAQRSYGYSDGLMQRLARGPLGDKINVGLCGLRSDSIDWNWLEDASRRLIEAEGTHYYYEQALIALWLAGEACAIAPENEYITLPRGAELLRRQAVMHHYVAESKRWYFQQNWRVCLSRAPAEKASSPAE